jgi:hypothetical protein
VRISKNFTDVRIFFFPDKVGAILRFLTLCSWKLLQTSGRESGEARRLATLPPRSEKPESSSDLYPLLERVDRDLRASPEAQPRRHVVAVGDAVRHRPGLEVDGKMLRRHEPQLSPQRRTVPLVGDDVVGEEIHFPVAQRDRRPQVHVVPYAVDRREADFGHPGPLASSGDTAGAAVPPLAFGLQVGEAELETEGGDGRGAGSFGVGVGQHRHGHPEGELHARGGIALHRQLVAAGQLLWFRLGGRGGRRGGAPPALGRVAPEGGRDIDLRGELAATVLAFEVARVGHGIGPPLVSTHFVARLLAHEPAELARVPARRRRSALLAGGEVGDLQLQLNEALLEALRPLSGVGETGARGGGVRREGGGGETEDGEKGEERQHQSFLSRPTPGNEIHFLLGF